MFGITLKLVPDVIMVVIYEGNLAQSLSCSKSFKILSDPELTFGSQTFIKCCHLCCVLELSLRK